MYEMTIITELKHEDDLKDEDNLKNEDEIRKKMTSKRKTTSFRRLSPALAYKTLVMLVEISVALMNSSAFIHWHLRHSFISARKENNYCIGIKPY